MQMDMNKLIEELEDKLRKNSMYYDVLQYGKLPVVAIEIEWGDWKHDHIALDTFMEKEYGVECASLKCTDENGSDAYSAIHYYYFGHILNPIEGKK